MRRFLLCGLLLGVVTSYATSATLDNGLEMNALNPNALNPNALNPNALNPNALNPNALNPNGLAMGRRDLSLLLRTTGRSALLAH